jgi:integrase
MSVTFEEMEVVLRDRLESLPPAHRLAWKPALGAADLPGFRFGQVRHTGATMALEAGANPVLVAFRLGHTSTRMVEQHDAGRLDRADKEIAAAFDARRRGTCAARRGLKRPAA